MTTMKGSGLGLFYVVLLVVALCTGSVIGDINDVESPAENNNNVATTTATTTTKSDNNATTNENNDNSNDNTISNNNPRIPPSCTLVMAPSAIPNSGWGVFSLTNRAQGEPVVAGDIVIQVGDLNTTHADGVRKLVSDYTWNAAETGGQYEGLAVLSVIPGIGMLANGSPTRFNILPALEPARNEAGCTRHSCPASGSFTHYFNYTFHVVKEVLAGDELITNYGSNWFQKREIKEDTVDSAFSSSTNPQFPERKLHKPVETLLETGFCLDNIKTGDSTIPSAGRGAFANRDMTAGAILAPVPVLPITKRDAMDITRLRQIAENVSIPFTTRQLLLNYCYGHPKSSVLLFPYSPMVNLINHSSKRTNVKLQWSSYNKLHEDLSLEQLRQINSNTSAALTPGGLLLELVATKNIAEGEELLLDYSNLWEEAWNRHVEQWEPYQGDYAPAYVFDEAVSVLGTQEEMQSKRLYPQNLITSCFYRYDTEDPALVQQFQRSKTSQNITTNQWRFSPGIFELRYLRPCTVMQRVEVETPKPQGDNKQQQQQEQQQPTEDADAAAEPVYYYTVVIRNRYGLLARERIPTGHMHVVTRVPRHAIRFTDRIYTTDQHLTGAFRHEIGLGDDIFPSQWMDLA